MAHADEREYPVFRILSLPRTYHSPTTRHLLGAIRGSGLTASLPLRSSGPSTSDAPRAKASRSVIRRRSNRRPRARVGLLLTGLGGFAGDWLITHPAPHARAVPLLAAPAVTLGVDDAGPRAAAACVFHDRSCFSRISSCGLRVHADRHQPHIWFAAILGPIRGRDLRALFPCREAMRPSLPRPTVRETAEDAMDLPISASGRFRAVQAETVGPLGLEPRTKGL